MNRLIDRLIAAATVKDQFEEGRRYINIRTSSNALSQMNLQAEAAKDE